MEKLALGKSTNKTKHEKEIRGLGKEIVWLRARLHREEKFRRDLAWSKGLMELGERVRVAWFVYPFLSKHEKLANMNRNTLATKPIFA